MNTRKELLKNTSNAGLRNIRMAFITIILVMSILLTACAGKNDSNKPLADGTYEAEVTLGGGTGRMSVDQCTLTVEGGSILAKLVLSSKNYTWLSIDGVQYDNETPGDYSTFTIPVSALGAEIPVSGETVAMSEPHVIDYTFTFSLK